MNESDLPDDALHALHALHALLRAAAPEPLHDDGFVVRTMAAVDRAARAVAVQPRAAPLAPIAIARALAAEHRRHEAQARLWRWAFAGVIAGFVLLVAATALSPDGNLTIAAPASQQWTPLCLLLAIGAIWIAWREARRN